MKNLKKNTTKNVNICVKKSEFFVNRNDLPIAENQNNWFREVEITRLQLVIYISYWCFLFPYIVQSALLVYSIQPNYHVCAVHTAYINILDETATTINL